MGTRAMLAAEAFQYPKSTDPLTGIAACCAADTFKTRFTRPSPVEAVFSKLGFVETVYHGSRELGT